MPTNAAAFNAELARFVDVDIPLGYVEIQGRIAKLALPRLVNRTPVDEESGEARGGWGVSLNVAFTGDRPPDPDGDATIADGLAVIAQAQPGDRIHIGNAEPHAVVLDQGGFVPPNPGPSEDPRPGRKGRVLVQGGYSLQAPQGMVDITVLELDKLRFSALPPRLGGPRARSVPRVGVGGVGQ